MQCKHALAILFSLHAPIVWGQTELRQVLERLERLERQNEELTNEVRSLRGQLTAAGFTASEGERAPGQTAERLEVQERRMEEVAQVKVEAASRLPVRLTGTLLFNAFSNGRNTGGSENPTSASLTEGPRTSSATLRQSTLGLLFDGSPAILGGKLSGSLYMDFFAGTNAVLNHTARIRTASIQMDWKNTTVLAGQLKPIFSPRDPTSLAQVGVDPLTGSGNLWFWQPQISVEQRFSLTESTSVRAQVGVIRTNELAAALPASVAPSLEASRPALEGRVELRTPNFEIAPGFHLSTTHVAGRSVPSNAFSLDWLYRPWRKVELTGFVFSGANLANLGALRQGFTIRPSGEPIAIRLRGGWAQLALLPTSRLSFHLMTGQQDARNSDLQPLNVGKNLTYAANVMYRIAPNVMVAFEGAQVRTTYIPSTKRKNNHYDLAIGYSF